MHVSAALLVALTIATASPEVGASAAGCGQGTVGVGSYAYAGYQAASTAHGVRATITTLSIPDVRAGHVAAWVGVGGRESGPGGADSWLQAGIAAWPGEEPFVYVEIVLDGRPELRTIAADVAPGRAHRLALLEIKQRPGWWRVWVDGSSWWTRFTCRARPPVGGRWRLPSRGVATGARATPSPFAFTRSALAGARGGSWRPFSAGPPLRGPGLPAPPARALVAKRPRRAVIRVRFAQQLARRSVR